MRRTVPTATLITTLVAVLALGVTSVFAANPHVVGTPTQNLVGTTLTLSASVAGLGNVSEATFSLEGTLDVFSRCYNRGGNKPQADNKQETLNVDAEETFPVRNGRTNATFVVEAESTLTCPGNQVVVIESISWDLDLIYEGTVLWTFTSP
jgi:hypothetical protein